MSFTAAAIQGDVQAQGYGTDTAAQQLTFLQGVLRRLYAQRRWRFLQKNNATITIALGASTCSLTTIADRQAGKIEGVRLVPATGDTVELEEIPWEDLRTLDAKDPSNDTPIFYARQDNDTLQFWPRADVPYTVSVDYISLPTLPAAGTDTVVWPDEHRDVLTWGVVVSMAFRQRDWFSTPTAQQNYAQALNEMTQAEQVNGSQSPSKMGHWNGWDRVSR